MRLAPNLRLADSVSGAVLAPYSPIMVRKYHQWMQHPELLELTCSEPLSLAEEYDMQRKWAEDEDKVTFIIHHELVREGHMAGDVNLYLGIDEDDASVGEIEVMVAEIAMRGKGLAGAAVNLMMDYAHRELNITTFRAKILEHNEISLRLFAKLGYVEVARKPIFKEIWLEKSFYVEKA